MPRVPARSIGRWIGDAGGAGVWMSRVYVLGEAVRPSEGISIGDSYIKDPIIGVCIGHPI